MDKERELLGHFERGMAFYRGGRLDESIAAFQAALAVDPKHAPSHYHLALRLESRGRNAEAAVAFEAFLRCADAEELKLEKELRSRIAVLKRGTKIQQGPMQTETLHAPSGDGDRNGSPMAMGWQPFSVIDGLYEVRALIGEGGFGTVHKVFHLGWGMELAVKSPRADKVAKRRALESFVQEANAWVGLGMHPNVVTCFYVRVQGVPRIFIEYMAGGSLAEWIEAGRVRELRVALDCAIQICRAMEYVHRRGLVHRDLKPANCLMTATGGLKITDFGLAKVGEADQDELVGLPGAKIAKTKPVTETGRLGTPEYMAPEQWSHPRDAAHGADIWAFGVVLYELLTGSRPFVAQDGEPLEYFYARLVGNGWAYPGPEGISPELLHLISRCLSVETSRRPSNFKEVIVVLEEVYNRTFDRNYPRASVKETPILADSLVNQGVSMADLGRTDEALRLFAGALRLDPVHAGATYNQGFLHASCRAKEGEDLATRLGALRRTRTGDWVLAYLLGQAHRIKGETEKAALAFAEAATLSGGNAFIRNALAGARPDLFVAPLKVSEAAEAETALFQRNMNMARYHRSRGENAQAYDFISRARKINGYEKSDEAMALTLEVGAEGSKVGIKGWWRKLQFRDSGGAHSLHFSKAGDQLISVHADGTVMEWDPETGARLTIQQAAPAPRRGFREVWTRDGRFLLFIEGDGSLAAVDAEDDRTVMSTRGHRDGIKALLISRDEGVIYTAEDDAVGKWVLDWDYDFSSHPLPFVLKSKVAGLVALFVGGRKWNLRRTGISWIIFGDGLLRRLLTRPFIWSIRIFILLLPLAAGILIVALGQSRPRDLFEVCMRYGLITIQFSLMLLPPWLAKTTGLERECFGRWSGTLISWAYAVPIGLWLVFTGLFIFSTLFN